MPVKRHERYMKEALKEAERALELGERPIGVLILQKSRMIARAHHQVKTLRDPTAHAAVIAITQAVNTLQSDHLNGTTIYLTQEPCCMCVGAILSSGISRLVFGIEDVKQGACGSVVNLPANERLNRKLLVVRDVLASECAAMLRRAPTDARPYRD